MARNTQVRTIVSGSMTTSTAIQMIIPTPSVPVSHGAIQWRRTVRAASASIAAPFTASR